jgi:hypothetical protein
LPVPALRLRIVAPALGKDAELVIAGRHPGWVTELFEDGESVTITAFGLGVVPALVGDVAELMVPGGVAG